MTVHDVNDNAPTVPLEQTFGHLLENEPSGTEFMRVHPVDVDAAPNAGPFTYRLVDSADQRLFHINRTSGIVSSRMSFDRESRSQYILEVEISDSGEPIRSAIVPLTINIDDVNDNPSETGDVHMTVVLLSSRADKGTLGTARPRDKDIVGKYNCVVERDLTSADYGQEYDVTAGCDLQLMQSIDAYRVYDAKHVLAMRADDGRHEGWLLLLVKNMI